MNFMAFMNFLNLVCSLRFQSLWASLQEKVFNLEEKAAQLIHEGGAHDGFSSFGRRRSEARVSAHALSHHVISSTMLTVQHEGYHQIQHHGLLPSL